MLEYETKSEKIALNEYKGKILREVGVDTSQYTEVILEAKRATGSLYIRLKREDGWVKTLLFRNNRRDKPEVLSLLNKICAPPGTKIQSASLFKAPGKGGTSSEYGTHPFYEVTLRKKQPFFKALRQFFTRY